jgi:MFS family permease
VKSLSGVIPPRGVTRALAVQMVVHSAGTGLLLASSVVFFKKYVGMSAAQIGLGLSLTGVVSLVTSMPLGALVDRLGGRRTWLPGVLMEALLLACYPLVHAAAACVGLMLLVSLAANVGQVGRGRYVYEIVPLEQRVRMLAHQRSALNIGYTAGSGLAGLALVFDTRPAYLALPLGNAVLVLAGAWLAVRLPASDRTAAESPRRRPARGVLRDWPFLALAIVNAIVGMHATLLGAVIPLWVTGRTDAPHATVAWFVVVNTVLVVVLQVYFSRGAESLPGAGRALTRAGLALGAACVVMALTSATRGLVTIGVVLLVAVLVTFAEMLQASGMWAIGSIVPPAEHRGKYLGAMYMARQLEAVISPVALVAITMSVGGGLGWLAVGAFVFAGGVLCRPAMSWVGRSQRVGGDSPSFTAAVPANSLPGRS